MKNYEELTNVVILRAKAQKAAQKRRQIKLAVAVTCVCCFALAVFAGAKTNLSADNGEIRDTRVSVFCITANAATYRQQMLKGEKVPYNALIRVRDIAGIGNLELVELQRADKEYADQMAGQVLDRLHGNPEWSVSTRIKDDMMITTIFVGSFYVEVDDYNQVKDVTTSTTEIGWTAQHLTNYYDETLADGIGITWGLSEIGVNMFEENPEMKLSELTDTITVTVEFNDGSKETVVIDITVDDNGQVYGTFQGSNVVE